MNNVYPHSSGVNAFSVATVRKPKLALSFVVFVVASLFGHIGLVSAQDDLKDPNAKNPIEAIQAHSKAVSERLDKIEQRLNSQQKAIAELQDERSEIASQIQDLKKLIANLETAHEKAKEVNKRNEKLTKSLQDSIAKLQGKSANGQAGPAPKDTGFWGDFIRMGISGDSEEPDKTIPQKAGPKVDSEPHSLDQLNGPLEEAAAKGLVFKGARELHGLKDIRNGSSAFDEISTMEFDRNSKSLILISDDKGKWIRVQPIFDSCTEALLDLKCLDHGSVVDRSGKKLEEIESSAWFRGDLYLGLDNGSIHRISKDIIHSDEDQWKARTVVSKDKLEQLDTGNDNGIEGLAVSPDGKVLYCFAESQGDYTDPKENHRFYWPLDGDNLGNKVSPKEYLYPSGVSKKHDVGGVASFKGDLFVLHKDWDKNGKKYNYVDICKFPAGKIEDKKGGEAVLFSAKSKNQLDNTECIICFEQGDKNYLALMTDDNDKRHQKTVFMIFEIVEQKPDDAAKAAK